MSPAYVTDKMALSDVAMLPGMFTEVCKGTHAYWKMATEGLLAKTDFGGNKIHPIFVALLPPYQVIGPHHPIKSFEDLKGIKIRSSGGSVDLTIRALGATPVKLTGPETREGLERGTIDANLGPNSSLKGYDIFPLAKYGTQGASFGSFVVTYSISDRVWNGLSDEVKQALAKAGEETNTHLCQAHERENLSAIKAMEDLGADFYHPTDADKQAFAATATSVAAQWAKELDDRGKQGSAALAEFKSELGK
ncbi:TRAP transporter substrate-binding protein DctP [Rhodoligotrophos appendicifer]